MWQVESLSNKSTICFFITLPPPICPDNFLFFAQQTTRLAGDIRHFLTTFGRFSYRRSSFLPMAEAASVWPNGIDSTWISIMAEKLLDRMRRIIRVKHYSLRTDVRTTMIYTHVVQRGALGARSPLDGMT